MKPYRLRSIENERLDCPTTKRAHKKQWGIQKRKRGVGKEATISCPHSYPLFYEPLGLDRGHRLLEVGLGSGYGAAVAREVVGPEGLVVSIEIDPFTFEFGRKNLENRGYHDIILVNDDGSLGYPAKSPYDRISITAACLDVPPPLIEQLKIGGRLISPVIEDGIQNLVLIEKGEKGIRRKVICEVLYVSLRGMYGVIWCFLIFSFILSI